MTCVSIMTVIYFCVDPCGVGGFFGLVVFLGSFSRSISSEDIEITSSFLKKGNISVQVGSSR